MCPNDEIINVDKDIEDCYWQRNVPLIITPKFINLEKKRLRQGAFIYIKDELFWLPPNYYFFLQYGIIGGGSPEFRLKELKKRLYKSAVRDNKFALGTFNIKNRQDGDTGGNMMDCLYELMDGVNFHGQINIQSKTNNDARKPCWSTLKSHWSNLPKWLKEIFYSDFTSGDNIEKQMKFERTISTQKDIFGKNIEIPSRGLSIQYYPSTFNAQDGSHNVILCVGDEICKWAGCSPAAFFTNAEKFIKVGSKRMGLFSLFSSPADVKHRYVDEVHRMWNEANSNELDQFGSTKNGLFAYHTDPLDGIEGYYDKYGDADAQEILEKIMYDRSKKSKEDLLGEIRANPLNEEEMFGSYNTNTLWSNQEGIIRRKNYVLSTLFKNEETKEPKYIWGNLEWKDGIPDTEVVFRPSLKNEFNLTSARFCFAYFPNFDTPLKNIFKPPLFIDSSLGFDPIHKQDTEGRQSNAAMVGYKFRELLNFEYSPRPTFIYSCRPYHMHIIFEDIIKAAVYTRSLIQYEGTSDEMGRYLKERGYDDWVAFKIGSKTLKGDAPRGKNGGQLVSNAMEVIDILTNVPIDPTKPYLLDLYWFEKLLEEIETFTPEDTHKFDLFMAYVQALLGAMKMSSVKKKITDKLSSVLINHVLS